MFIFPKIVISLIYFYHVYDSYFLYVKEAIVHNKSIVLSITWFIKIIHLKISNSL